MVETNNPHIKQKNQYKHAKEPDQFQQFMESVCFSDSCWLRKFKPVNNPLQKTLDIPQLNVEHFIDLFIYNARSGNS